MTTDLVPYRTPMTVERFSKEWSQFHLRWEQRNLRMDKINRIVHGDWTVVAPDDEQLISRSPNMVQVALEDTAESSAMTPTIRVQASSSDPKDKESATKMEQLAASYLDVSEFPMLAIKSFLDLYAYGLFSWVVTYTHDAGPKIEWRDPRTFYPEPDFSTLSTVKRGYFARDLYFTQLPMEWQFKMEEHRIQEHLDSGCFNDMTLTLIEYYDCDRVSVGVAYNAAAVPGANFYLRAEPSTVTVLLEDYENPLGVCQIVAGQVPKLDPEPHGQFDQVVDILLTHIQLMALVLDYSDDLVYSDIWVRDLIGSMPQGGKSYIQLGPQGQIGRVPPASPSFSLFNELQQLMESFHLGARWPKQRTGESGQSQASGRLMETAVGMMNTVLKTGHTVMKRALEAAVDVSFIADKKCGPKRTISGVLKNQQFLVERDRDDIDLKAQTRVDYGIGFGRDPSEAAVLAIQYHQSGFVSTETVQENLPGIVDVGLERQRLLLQQFRDMALAKVLQGLQEKSIPDKALVEMARAVQDGQDTFEVFKKYIVDPAEAMMEEQYPSALGSGMLTPGPGAAPAGGPAPQAPPPEELLAGLLGGGEEGPETIGRLSAPLPGGGFAGSQATT